jgi:hypothetical protein
MMGRSRHKPLNTEGRPGWPRGVEVILEYHPCLQCQVNAIFVLLRLHQLVERHDHEPLPSSHPHRQRHHGA